MTNKVGRPLKYTDPQDMQEDIDRYFWDCYENRMKAKQDRQAPHLADYTTKPYDSDFFKTTENLHPTVAGLGRAIGMSRWTIMRYEQTDEFCTIIQEAKEWIEDYNEQSMHGPNANGVKFILTNGFNWKDKSERELSGPGGSPLQTSFRVEFVDAPKRIEENNDDKDQEPLREA